MSMHFGQLSVFSSVFFLINVLPLTSYDIDDHIRNQILGWARSPYQNSKQYWAGLYALYQKSLPTFQVRLFVIRQTLPRMVSWVPYKERTTTILFPTWWLLASLSVHIVRFFSSFLLSKFKTVRIIGLVRLPPNFADTCGSASVSFF